MRKFFCQLPPHNTWNKCNCVTIWRNVLLFISKRYLLTRDLLSCGPGHTSKDRLHRSRRNRKKHYEGPRIHSGRILRLYKSPLPLHLTPDDGCGVDVPAPCVFSRFSPFLQTSLSTTATGTSAGECEVRVLRLLVNDTVVRWVRAA